MSDASSNASGDDAHQPHLFCPKLGHTITTNTLVYLSPPHQARSLYRVTAVDVEEDSIDLVEYPFVESDAAINNAVLPIDPVRHGKVRGMREVSGRYLFTHGWNDSAYIRYRLDPTDNEVKALTADECDLPFASPAEEYGRRSNSTDEEITLQRLNQSDYAMERFEFRCILRVILDKIMCTARQYSPLAYSVSIPATFRQFGFFLQTIESIRSSLQYNDSAAYHVNVNRKRRRQICTQQFSLFAPRLSTKVHSIVFNTNRCLEILRKSLGTAAGMGVRRSRLSAKEKCEVDLYSSDRFNIVDPDFTTASPEMMLEKGAEERSESVGSNRIEVTYDETLCRLTMRVIHTYYLASSPEGMRVLNEINHPLADAESQRLAEGARFVYSDGLRYKVKSRSGTEVVAERRDQVSGELYALTVSVEEAIRRVIEYAER